ncbi:DUF3253 domain-containing protein [Xylophilus sp. Leaf220]|uniref:DUF3253 domain-containing protein n=1 Tax=Xylophilus sp. Leaf220 TaxID=1735686 RepID=UPI0006F7F483|nr:DUF3253 domain-containing protein [Xylophilus sp. Leaf220]KQM80373.1 hypothetical protein ASE76_04365 [Xylophilus sp. Leaf220]
MDKTAAENQIFALLARRKAGATICPSEVARALVAGSASWHELMPGIRQVAADLARNGRLVVTRGGVSVDAIAPGGPVRLGLPVPAPRRGLPY